MKKYFRFPEKYRIEGIAGLDTFSIPHKGQFIFCIASVDAGIWEHASVTISYPNRKPKRCPTWGEMCLVKDLFWSEEVDVIQFHPKKSHYVKQHPFCLHLWRPVNGDLKLPKL